MAAPLAWLAVRRVACSGVQNTDECRPAKKARGTLCRIEILQLDHMLGHASERLGERFKGKTVLLVQVFDMLEAQAKPDTRSRILDVAESAVLAKGFASTSVEEIIAAVGITKSGFFYHFRDKRALAKSLMLRYLEQDKRILDDLFARADELNEDPLHGLLVALKLFAEMMANLPEAHPGCLAASFCYQDQLFDREIRELNAGGVLAWRKRFRARLDLIIERYPPRQAVDVDAFADMAATLVEGGLVLGRALNDVSILPRQIMLYRDFVRSTFLVG